MKQHKSDLHDLLVETDRAELWKYASYLLEPDHDRTLVLTTHVVAERLLEGMISTVLVYPDAWLREADFRSKVSLARALGLIEQRGALNGTFLTRLTSSYSHGSDHAMCEYV